MIPLKKLLDPLLLLGIIFLGVFKYLGILMSENPLEGEMLDLALVVKWLFGATGLVGIIAGVIRPIVVAMLQRQYRAAVAFYVTFWLVLCVPAFYLSVGVMGSPAKLYWGMLSVLFLLVNIFVGISLMVAKSMPKRNKLS